MAKIYAFSLVFALFIFESNWKSVSLTNVWLTVSGNQTVSEGGNVIFTCRSSTNNTVSWLDASYNTLPSTNGVLRLYSVTRNQNGNYFCRTNIGGLMLSRMVTLTVNYKPGNAQFTASNTSPLNGTDVTLRCSSNARPAPQYQIYIPGGQTLYNGPNGVYIIKNINRRSFGTYRVIFKCYAYNSQGSGPASYLQVNIRAAPVVRMTPNVQTLVAKEGTIIELKCEVLEGNPSPAVLWKRAGQSFQSYYRLTIHATRYSADTYTCVVTNTLTTVINSVRLIVEYPPVVHISFPEELCTDQKLEISCYADGFPIPDVKLVLGNNELNSGKGSTRYTISRVASQNYGQYSCRASNSMGSRTSSKILRKPSTRPSSTPQLESNAVSSGFNPKASSFVAFLAVTSILLIILAIALARKPKQRKMKQKDGIKIQMRFPLRITQSCKQYLQSLNHTPHCPVKMKIRTRLNKLAAKTTTIGIPQLKMVLTRTKYTPRSTKT